jgi:hypothetical protein
MVWKYIDRDADKTCLALTCKHNAKVYESITDPNTRQQVVSPEQRLAFMKRLTCFGDNRKKSLCFSCGKYMGVVGEWWNKGKYEDKLQVTRAQRSTGPKCES